MQPLHRGIFGEPSGTLKGQEQGCAYWQLEVFACVSSSTIYYHAVLGKRATQSFFLDESRKVFKALSYDNQ